jgi:23S rRNA pseudouridine1911/1915/1917 synthase
MKSHHALFPVLSNASVLWCFFLVINHANAFLSSIPIPSHMAFFHIGRLPSVQCWAKAPPTSSFDLSQVEAFESQMDRAALEMESGMARGVYDVADEIEDDTYSRSSNVQMHTVPPALNGKRIDAALADLEPTLSRSLCGTLVADGMVALVEGNKRTILDRKSYKVETGMLLRVSLPVDEKPIEMEAQDIPLDILFEDEHMIVLNKAAGMVVHPAAGNWDGTVVNALAYHLTKSEYGSGDFVDADGKIQACNDDLDIEMDGVDGELASFRPGIVHRLDKGTTGVLVVAKTTRALAALSQAFSARKVKKTYLAITVGNPGRKVVIDKPIGRHPIHRQRMRVVPDPHKKNSSGMTPKAMVRIAGAPPPASQTGRRALSFVDTLSFDQKLSLVQVRIETGRTHQIRVHLQDRHTPIYGDDVYGLADWNKRLYSVHQIDRPLLHAWRLEIDHPITGEHMVFVASMAEDMKRIATNVWPQGEEERPDIFQ